MQNFGIKVGNDIETDSDLDLKLISKFSSLKLFKWGDAQITTDGSGQGSVTIPHNLGYTPINAVFKKLTAQFTFLSATTYPNSFRQLGPFLNSYDSVNPGFWFYADDTNLYISTFGAIGGYFPGPVQPNTTYYFRYMIFVDLSEAFSDASNISLTGDLGFKFSQDGKNVFEAEEYDMAYSTKYKSIQYYPNHVLTKSVTLPVIKATSLDSGGTKQEATYIDFNHNLGYPPFFMVFADLPPITGFPSGIYEKPDTEVSPVGMDIDGISEVSSFCDSSRVRVLFRRQSWVVTGFEGKEWPEKTLNVYVIIFAENLAGEESP